MTTSENLTKLLPALLAARRKFKPVTKASQAQIGSGRSYLYADLSQLLAAVTPALLEHDLLIIQAVDAQSSSLVTRLVHSSGEFVETRYPLNLDQGPQALGSAVTYSRRYQLQSMLSVSAADDDGAAAQSATADRPPRGKVISKAQVEKLWTTARSHGWSDDVLKKHLIFRYRVNSSTEIKAADFDELLKQLEAGAPDEQSAF